MKENIKAPRHWPLCGEFNETGEFPAQRTSNAENVSIWWRHHDIRRCYRFNRMYDTGDKLKGLSMPLILDQLSKPELVIARIFVTRHSPQHITLTTREHHFVSNQWYRDCLLSSLSRLQTKEITKLRTAGPLWGKSTGHWGILLPKWIALDAAILW